MTKKESVLLGSLRYNGQQGPSRFLFSFFKYFCERDGEKEKKKKKGEGGGEWVEAMQRELITFWSKKFLIIGLSYVF